MPVRVDARFLRGLPESASNPTPDGTANEVPGTSPWEQTGVFWEDGDPAAALASLPAHFGGLRPVPPSFLAAAGATSTPVRDEGVSLAGAGSTQAVQGSAGPSPEASLPPGGAEGAGVASDQLHGNPLRAPDASVASGGGRSGSDGGCSISLVASEPSPQLVGEQVTWTATANNCPDKIVYQFSVGPTDGPRRMVRDYSSNNAFQWAPMQEGVYDVRVTIKAGFNATETWYAGVTDTVNSRVTGTDAVVTETTNPLVALYSAPPCEEGTVQVQFRPLGASDWMHTDAKPCSPGLSSNFLVAGMLPNWTYEMVDVTSNGTSLPRFFTTGAPPAELVFPEFAVSQPPGPESDVSQNMVLHMAIIGPTPAVSVLATDLMGRVEWYYDPLTSGLNSPFATSLVPGGTVLLLDVGGHGSVLREVDLAGNPLRETNQDAINAQLTARGNEPINALHHDAQRLPDGRTVVLGSTVKTVDVKGTPTEYVGDVVIVLDENFQVLWTWDAFDYLDVNRGPILGELCGFGGCSGPPDAVDWLHTNAVAWSPVDGNLVLSVRHQDWVIKIDYSNGAGDGHVIWRLGQDGDFTINSKDPYPWFSHQHNVSYSDDTTLVLFDNGNTRCVDVSDCNSRGQALTLNEKSMEATLLVNADLGNNSPALGGAQQLPSGNFVFTSGYQFESLGQSIEVLPDGSKTYVLDIGGAEYRSYRMSGLYG